MSMSTTTKLPRGHLRFDARTNEPYLPLTPPPSSSSYAIQQRQLSTIRITPVRADEYNISAMVASMNDPIVVRNLSSPPYPYTLDHARSFLTRLRQTYDATEFVQGTAYATISPVRSLRDVQPDGTDVYIGDIDMGRWNFAEILSLEERKRVFDENNKKEAGDPTIVWSFGDFLAPSHRGRGIMSAAIHTMIHQWAVPVLNAKHIKAAAFKDNIASQRTFLKNGFKLVHEAIADGDMTHKGRPLEEMTLRIYEWQAEDGA